MKVLFLSIICSVASLSASYSHSFLGGEGNKHHQHKAPNGFYKSIGGNGLDAANAIIKTKDGSFVLAGRSNSYGAGDMNMNLVKVDASGNVSWNKTFGADESEEATALIQTSKGDIIAVGYSDSYGAGPDLKDFWAVKVDNAGNKVWDKVYGSKESIDEATSIVETEDGGFLILGTTTPISSAQNDLMLIKISAAGEKVWQKTYGGAKSEEAGQIIKAQDGNYVIVANTESFGKGKWDIWLINIDKDGNKVWESTFGGGDNERANAVKQDKDGNFVVAGYTYTFSEGSHDAWVVKADKNGKQIWSKVVGGPSTDEAFDLAINANNEIIVAGYTDIYKPDPSGENESPEGNDVLIVKFSPDGKEIWKKTLGGNKMQVAKGIAPTDDGGYMLSGFTNESEDEKSFDMFVMRVSAEGDK